MFGDKAIFGQAETSRDEKGRIFIPAFTNREKGDELVLIYDDMLKVHEIYSETALKQRFDELEQKILDSKTQKEVIFYKKMLYQLSKSILKKSIVDSQGRMSIGKTFEGEERLSTTGAYNRLIIEPIKKK